VDGAAPFEFQWQRNGADIDGANGASYTIDKTTFADSGDGFRCIITNNFGSVTSVAGTLTVANSTRPTPTLLSPAINTMYSGGETIEYSGSGYDEQDGALPDSAFTWRVDLHHDQHAHPFIPPTTGAKSGSFVIPTVGETSDNVWYRIYLTVTDSQGLATTTFRGEHGAPETAGVVMPVAWTRRFGRGRVFVSTLGHAPGDLVVPEVRTLTERGMLWSANVP